MPCSSRKYAILQHTIGLRGEGIENMEITISVDLIGIGFYRKFGIKTG